MPRERLTPLPPDLRRWLPSLPAFRANVGAIIDAARARGVGLLFLTQPLWYGEGPPWDALLANAVQGPR